MIATAAGPAGTFHSFAYVAGELRAYQSGADWFADGDTNGDGVADLVNQVSITDPTLLILEGERIQPLSSTSH